MATAAGLCFPHLGVSGIWNTGLEGCGHAVECLLTLSSAHSAFAALLGMVAVWLLGSPFAIRQKSLVVGSRSSLWPNHSEAIDGL